MSDPSRAPLPTGTVTFVFTDIEGSTRLLQELGEAYKPVLEDHALILRQTFEKSGGIEISTEGDAFFVVFLSAHDAVEAAAEAQRRLAEYAWPKGVSIKVRMGLHTGTAISGGDNYVGIDVHRAARISSAGHGGQVLLSEATKILAERGLGAGISFRDLEEHRLKDLADPEHIYQLDIAGLRTEFPPILSLSSRSTNLPIQLTNFIGREQELATAHDLLGGSRLLTLTGPGGTGKTRLALQLGAEVLDAFGDGVFFVALSEITDPNLVPNSLANAIRMEVPKDRPLVEAIKEYLSPKELLLIFDNFEQITDAATLVGDLLESAPSLKTIVTSRESLRIAGEQEFQVPPLRLPDLSHLPAFDLISQYDSVALFIQRAMAVDPAFEVTAENAPAVAEITSRLDGLPLAIELAAARIKLLSPDQILARMQDRLGLLEGKARDLPARQQTLRNAIAWSFDLLDGPEQQLFSRLAVFAGGFTLESAEQVVSQEMDIEVFDGISSLLDKSLLRQDRHERAQGRFIILQTIKDFASERLEESNEAAGIRRNHAEYFAALMRQAEVHLTGEQHENWLNRLTQEHENLRSAFRWMIEVDESDMGMSAASSIWRYWQFRGHLAEGRTTLEQLLMLPSAVERTASRAKALDALASVVYWQYDYSRAEALYKDSLEIYEALGDLSRIGWERYCIATTHEMRDDFQKALPWVERALEAYELSGDRFGIALAKAEFGWIEMFMGKTDKARHPLEEALEVFVEVGDRYQIANTHMALAYVNEWAQAYEAARREALSGLIQFNEIKDLTGVALSLNVVADICIKSGNPEKGLRLAAAAEAIRDRVGGGAPPGTMQLPDPRDSARPLLDPDTFDRSWTEGAAMSADEAVDLATSD